MKLYLVVGLIVLIMITTVYLLKSNEGFYTTYLNSPNMRGIYPTDIGYYYGWSGAPFLYTRPGFLPYNRRRFRRRFYPRFRRPYFAEYFTTGGESERNNGNCVKDCESKLYSYGYPKHGFEKICELETPKDTICNPLGRVDLPMLSPIIPDKNYEIGRWVFLGHGFPIESKNYNKVVNVHQFNIDPSRQLYRFRIEAEGQLIDLDVKSPCEGLVDGYTFYVPELRQKFLLRTTK